MIPSDMPEFQKLALLSWLRSLKRKPNSVRLTRKRPPGRSPGRTGITTP